MRTLLQRLYVRYRLLITVLLVILTAVAVPALAQTEEQEITCNVEPTIAVRIAPDGTPEYCSNTEFLWWWSVEDGVKTLTIVEKL